MPAPAPGCNPATPRPVGKAPPPTQSRPAARPLHPHRHPQRRFPAPAIRILSAVEQSGTPEVLAQVTRGQWAIESVHWLRDTAWREDQNTGYAGTGPQVMASLRNIAVSLLHIAGVTEILRTLQAICRDRNRILDYLPL